MVLVDTGQRLKIVANFSVTIEQHTCTLEVPVYAEVECLCLWLSNNLPSNIYFLTYTPSLAKVRSVKRSTNCPKGDFKYFT